MVPIDVEVIAEKLASDRLVSESALGSFRWVRSWYFRQRRPVSRDP